MWWDKFKKNIIDSDLYTRSGTAVGVSNDILGFEEKDGDYHPIKLKNGDIPEIAYQSLSDLGVDYPKLNKHVFGDYPKNWLIGNYKKIFVGYFKDKDIRKNASSGGIISGAQSYLLEKKKVGGVVTLRMRKDKPYLTEPIIARSRKEVMEGAQSKYTISPVNQILSKTSNFELPIVYTGLPDQVASIRKLQAANHDSVKKIEYVFGIFHGESLYSSAITSFLRAHGVKNINDVVSLRYRDGEWPGNMKVVLKNGRIISVKKFHANYLIPSHITKFSLYQVDYTNELADISVGDAWAPTYEERGDGWSVIIARTEKGLELLNSMLEEDKIFLKEISEDEFINMHSHGLDLKKRGAFIRIDARKKKGLITPDYGYRPVNMPKGRIRFEKILAILFIIFQNRITIWVLEKIPHQIIGWFFVKARKIWKSRTKTTKKGSLNDLKFEIT
jgi:coenzyme F420 hydrogenase subunit beta